MSEYNIFLIESANKTRDGFSGVSQDLIISGLNQKLKGDTFVGKMIEDGDSFKLIFKDSKHLNLLEKISRTLKISNFNISVSPEMLAGEEVLEPIAENITVNSVTTIEEAPKSQETRIFRRPLDQIFPCPFLSSNPSELGIFNSEHIKGYNAKDAYNCLFDHEGLKCPLKSICKEQQFMSAVTQSLDIENYDAFIFDFVNNDREMSLVIDKTGRMCLAPAKK
jgi:hypothetical protein